MTEKSKEHITAIRERFGLQSDAQAVIYALNELATSLRLMVPAYTQEEIAERLNTIADQPLTDQPIAAVTTVKELERLAKSKSCPAVTKKGYCKHGLHAEACRVVD